jgi:DNA-binding winged helix-turn-helix (wHTH) protein
MKYRIGTWTACADSDTLTRDDGVRRKLERRAMETLTLLARNAGEVVKKDQLIETVWGRLAVSDHSVAMVISQLRRVLGDDARAPHYIETITKRGYRLMAPCEVLPSRTDAITAPHSSSAVVAARAEQEPATFLKKLWARIAE